MKLLRTVVTALALVIPTTEALALSAVSRACRFSEIPLPLRYYAGEFFYLLGAPPIIRFMAGEDIEVQKRYWINESLTTDWRSVKYYLYAQRTVYNLTNLAFGAGQQWVRSHADSSPKWTAESISSAMAVDPTFSPYRANRKFLYSARAGASSIVEDLSDRLPFFVVVGNHYYFDPVSQVTAQLPDTKANDCNLSVMGYGFFDR